MILNSSDITSSVQSDFSGVRSKLLGRNSPPMSLEIGAGKLRSNTFQGEPRSVIPRRDHRSFRSYSAENPRAPDTALERRKVAAGRSGRLLSFGTEATSPSRRKGVEVSSSNLTEGTGMRKGSGVTSRAAARAAAPRSAHHAAGQVACRELPNIRPSGETHMNCPLAECSLDQMPSSCSSSTGSSTRDPSADSLNAPPPSPQLSVSDDAVVEQDLDIELVLTQDRLQQAQQVIRKQELETAALKAYVQDLEESSRTRSDSNVLGSSEAGYQKVREDDDIFATDVEIDALCRKSEVLLRKIEEEVHWCALMNAPEARSKILSQMKELHRRCTPPPGMSRSLS